MENKSVDFFEMQFRRQVATGEYVLNPFDRLPPGSYPAACSISAAPDGAKKSSPDTGADRLQKLQIELFTARFVNL